MSLGTSSKRESAILVVQDIECWWSKTGIKLKTSGGILHMVMAIVDQYLALKKIRVEKTIKKKKIEIIF